jgi:hypothetical protein
MPPAGAAVLRVTVPVEDLPPLTVVGFRVSATITGGVTVRFALWTEVPSVAVMVEIACAVTTFVLTVNVALVCPAGIVTEAGTDTTGLALLVSAITAPPVPAGPLSVTVPVDVLPPATVVGLTLTETRASAVMVSVALVELDPTLAIIVAGVDFDTADVVIVNCAVVEPDATVTFAGGEALVLLEDSLTTVPPDGAASLSVTVPVADAPPATVLGEITNELTPTGATSVTVAGALVLVPLLTVNVKVSVPLKPLFGV